jgi:glyoxylase-like metal-dependent hydrolase (beta-lactamase superfamily II)
MTAATGAEALPFALFPTKTFAYRLYSMYLNGEGIQALHMPAATTDGDLAVFFRRGDVIATGDIIDTTRWPFIDTKRGGTLQGELDALNRLMDLAILNVPIQWNPDRTLLVPGHGFVYDKLDLLEYRDAVTVVRDRVQALIDEGKTLAQIKATDPTLGYRSQYGADKGPWTTDMFVEVIYNELAAAKKGTSK